MPLNILFALVIGFLFGAVAFGFWFGVILAIVAAVVTAYWDQIENWAHGKLDIWTQGR